MERSESREKFFEFIDEYMNPQSKLAKQVKKVFDEWWNDFIELPSSSTRKYHHSVENYIPYGLLNHTMRVVWIANELAKEEKMNKIQTHKVIAAALLHDLGKIKTKKSSHGEQSVEMIEDIIDDFDVQQMVLRHMHMWSDWPLTSIFTIVVAYADYIASHKEVEITSLKYFKEYDNLSNEELEMALEIEMEAFDIISEKIKKERTIKNKKKRTLMDF